MFNCVPATTGEMVVQETMPKSSLQAVSTGGMGGDSHGAEKGLYQPLKPRQLGGGGRISERLRDTSGRPNGKSETNDQRNKSHK